MRGWKVDLKVIEWDIIILSLDFEYNFINIDDGKNVLIILFEKIRVFLSIISLV